MHSSWMLIIIGMIEVESTDHFFSVPRVVQTESILLMIELPAVLSLKEQERSETANLHQG